MKFKKVLSLALGAIMALSVSVTALAADTTQYYGVFYKSGTENVSMVTNALGQDTVANGGKDYRIDITDGVITMDVTTFSIWGFSGGLTNISDTDTEDGIDVVYDAENSQIVVTFADNTEIDGESDYTYEDLLGNMTIECTATYYTIYSGHTTSATVDFKLINTCPGFVTPMS